MKKDYIILTLAILTGVLIIERFRKKNDSVDVEEVLETTAKFSDADIKECEKAVDLVMNEKLKFIRMTKDGIEKMRKQELEKCLNS